MAGFRIFPFTGKNKLFVSKAGDNFFYTVFMEYICKETNKYVLRVILWAVNNNTLEVSCSSRVEDFSAIIAIVKLNCLFTITGKHNECSIFHFLGTIWAVISF